MKHLRRAHHRALVPLFTMAAACGGSEPRPAPPVATRPAPAPAPSPNPPPAAESSPPELRLADTVEPTGYQLRLELDPAAEEFRGHVDIAVRITAATDHVWLNAKNLTIAAPAITIAGDRRALVAFKNRTEDLAGFGFGRTVEPGAAVLHFDFTGKAPSDDVAGLFRQEDGGRWYLFSQLESTYARRVFPCFDEPRFKVPWQVTLVVPEAAVALSNAPVEREGTPAAGKKEVVFAATPPLPSYLVAVAVGPFELVDVGRIGRNQIPARIAVQAGRAADARYAAQMTPRLVAALETYFDMPLPFDKLDQVAIPNFPGAMENPGLITYGARILTTPPDKETEFFRRSYVSIGGHELAHLWFGDLVTLRWWDDTWLNESFATWMSEKIGEPLAPGWDAAIRAIDQAGGAMNADASPTARPLRRPISTLADIEGAFDAISYAKGGAVLSMFERWIGPDRFRDGVRAYLRQHARGTTTAFDFLDALAQVSSPDVRRAFTAFLQQPGVPLVTASLRCSGKPVLHLRQQRLAATTISVTPGAESGGTWPLPVCVRHAGAGRSAKIVEQCQLVDGAESEIALDAATCPAWVVANAGAAGYFQVVYDAGLARNLIRALPRLSAAERMALARDTAALVHLGHADIGASLDLATALLTGGDEHSTAAAVELITGTRAVVDDVHLPAWHRYVVKTLGRRAQKLGFAPAPEAAAARSARNQLLAAVALEAQEPALVKKARALSDAWLDGKGGIALDDLGLVLSIAARNGDAPFFDRIEKALAASKERSERATLIRVLGQFSDPALVDRSLQLLAKGDFEMGELFGLIGPLFGRVQTQARAWAYFKSNYDAVLAKLPVMARGYAGYLASGFCDAATRKDADEFLRPRMATLAHGPRALEQAFEQVDRCIALRERNAAAVAQRFAPR